METEMKHETEEPKTDHETKSENNISISEPVKDTVEEEKESIKKKATLLFLQGKRSIFIRDYQAAAAALSDACQLFNQIYSEQDDALGDPYFYYGKALLEVARSESEVLGDQMQEDKDEDEDEEDDNDENDDNDNGNGNIDNQSNHNNDDKKVEENKDGSNNSKDVLCSENSLKSPKGQSESFNRDNEEKDSKVSKECENSKVDENGEVNDLQLSWEYLELAKLIYLRKADICKETAVKLAETYLCLGENGLESENYSTAIEDINQALELQKKHLKEEDRRIAETYYQLGMAYSLDQNYDEAIESFKKAIEQLEKKISSLEMRKKVGDSKTEEEEKDAFYTMDGEINEIKIVIKDIDEKIKDMLECKNQVKAELVKQVYGKTQDGSSTSAGDGTSFIPATDISHLVRKKRKNDNDEEHQEKKMKTDN